MKKHIIITAVLIILVGSGAFYAGTEYQKKRQPVRQFGQYSGGNQSVTRRSGTGNMVRPVRGEIISSDDKSITVKMPDGSSRIVIVPAKAIITEASDAVKESLGKGVQVMVFGSENPDGTITAQNIQINPQNRGFDMREGPGN